MCAEHMSCITWKSLTNFVPIRPVLNNFRREIVRSSTDCLGVGIGTIQDLCNPEVSQFYNWIVQEYIFSLIEFECVQGKVDEGTLCECYRKLIYAAFTLMSRWITLLLWIYSNPWQHWNRISKISFSNNACLLRFLFITSFLRSPEVAYSSSR